MRRREVRYFMFNVLSSNIPIVTFANSTLKQYYDKQMLYFHTIVHKPLPQYYLCKYNIISDAVVNKLLAGTPRSIQARSKDFFHMWSKISREMLFLKYRKKRSLIWEISGKAYAIDFSKGFCIYPILGKPSMRGESVTKFKPYTTKTH